MTKGEFEKETIGFLEELRELTSLKGLNLEDLMLDHVGFQVSSPEEYEKLKSEVLLFSELLREALVSNRKVGMFKLINPIKIKDQELSAFEIFEPKEGENTYSHFEHAEYIPDVSLEEFMKLNPNYEWDTSALNRDEFPMLILRLNDSIRIKFPRKSILSE